MNYPYKVKKLVIEMVKNGYKPEQISWLFTSTVTKECDIYYRLGRALLEYDDNDCDNPDGDSESSDMTLAELDNQLDQLKNRGMKSIEYYTEDLEDPANKKILSYYEVLNASAKNNELTLSIKDIPPLPEDGMRELKDIKKKLLNSIQKLLKEDRILILLDTNERTITHMLTEYLQDEFNDFNVDCEYNRSFDMIKKLDIPKDLLMLTDSSSIKWDDTYRSKDGSLISYF